MVWGEKLICFPAICPIRRNTGNEDRSVMRRIHLPALRIILAVLFAHLALAKAQEPGVQETGAAAIQQAIREQADAWNRGDVEAFMKFYKNAPDTTFIGKTLQQGYGPILERYRKAYPNKDAMGTLDFSAISVRKLGPGYAVVTGRFHLARNAAGGGDASGIFSLVWEKTPEGWRIILDHTSVD
jgi:uncharacterized protein (TIGR02246 family)